MNKLSRAAALAATAVLAAGFSAQAAELKSSPMLKQQQMSVPSQPALKESLQKKEDTDESEKAKPRMMKPAAKPMAQPVGKPSADAPQPKSLPAPTNLPKPKTPPKALEGKPGLKTPPQLKQPIGRGCPDPAIVRLTPGWPQRHDDGTYTFKLMATIKNIGDRPYRSRNDQQSITLKEGNRKLETFKWPDNSYHPDYAPGEAHAVVHAITRWNPSSEFLADFTAQLSYDPDITLDGNPENDDCRNTNNSARLSVAELKRQLEESTAGR